MNDEITPLPIKQFVILLAVRFSEPVSFSLLFPFVYFMVRDFDITHDSREIGYYVGYIASSFAISQLCTSILWGHLSDKIGRKPVIIFGLLGSSISMLLFGLSKSLAWAITIRAMSGLLNGNLGVVKSMITELTDSTNRAKGFSYLPLVYCIGTIFGPILGGYLSNPVERYPSIFQDSQLFKEYPYLLPCLVSSLLFFCSSIFAILFLEETLNKCKHVIEEAECFIPRNSNKKYSTIDSDISFEQDVISSSATQQPSFWKLLSKETYLILLGAMILSFTTTFSDELIPLWAASSEKIGGLGFTSTMIGNFMSLTGISAMLIQFIIYTKLQRRYGSSKIYKAGSFLFIPIFLGYPVATDYLMGHQMELWTYLIVLSILKVSIGIFSYTVINVMISDTTSRRILGTVNGIDGTVRALSRSLAPIIFGVLWTWSLTNDMRFPYDYHFTWYFLAVLSFSNFFLANFINSKLTY